MNERGNAAAMTRSLWTHRALILRLTRRDLVQRYVGSALGFFWAAIYPLVLLGVYTLVFGTILQLRLGESRDPFLFALYLLAGLLPWQMTAESMMGGAGCLLENANIVKKTVFPKEILPASVVLGAAARMGIGFVLFLALLLASGRAPGIEAVALPAVVLLHAAFCLGLAWFLAAANAMVRDVAHIVGAFSLIWFLLTPVVYPASYIAEADVWIRRLVWLNPAYHVVTLYRAPLLFGMWPPAEHLLWLAAEAGAMLLVGGAVFAGVRRTVADLL